MSWILSVLIAVSVLLSCSPAAAQGNPILPGDHPDPSIIRANGFYWASNTSAEWAPVFPIFRSSDLRNWQTTGSVFRARPDWAVRNFWAPELVNDRGHFRVYYAARKKDGPLCVAVATASAPQGPYEDHGPLVCQPDGAIDPAFVRDESGKPFLIWKEDANSIHQPTKIWIQPTSEDGLHLLGSPTAILTNDAAWEGEVVEGPYILRHGDYFYLFYAGGACCGERCSYGEGVARARNLHGPWQKDPSNPIIATNAEWKCPGHGTLVRTASGSDYLMHHAYPQENSIFIGRESVVERVAWNAKGWPEINGGKGVPGISRETHRITLIDDFKGPTLSPTWQWPIADGPGIRIADHSLRLAPLNTSDGDPLGAIVAQTLPSPSFRVTVEVSPGSSEALASIAVLGSARDAVGIGIQHGALVQWRRDHGRWVKLAVSPLPNQANVFLGIAMQGERHLNTVWSQDGKRWQSLGKILKVDSLPPWDTGLRVGLACGGNGGGFATFQHFSLRTPDVWPAGQTTR
ncbi:family 43 glycosylhydrolase [Silvibacterium bohemicum]|nr:family 43 glycosylhydrolase [Silvibacterium bohemicum]